MKIEIAQRPPHRSRARRRPRRHRCTSRTARSRRSAPRRPAGTPTASSMRAVSSSRRASSTSPRGCASPGSSTRRRSNRRCAAAIAGGVTSLACPPDTDPPLDEPGLVEMLKHRARSLNQAHVYPVGALTVGLQGTTLTEMGELAEAGCVAFSQADVPLVDTQLLLRAMQYASTFGHPRVAAAAGSAPRRAAASRTTARWPRASACRRFRRCAETIALATILALVRETGVRVHLCRLSSRRRRGDGARREARGPADHLRRRGPSPAPVRRRHRLVRPAAPPGAAAARRRATARRCARASPTARSTSSAPITRRSTTTASRCRSAKRSPAPPASSCCCRSRSNGRARKACRLPRRSRGSRARRRESSASRPATSRVGRARRCLHLRSRRRVDGRARARCAARARTRRSSGSKCRERCVTRWSAARSFTRASDAVAIGGRTA